MAVVKKFLFPYYTLANSFSFIKKSKTNEVNSRKLEIGKTWAYSNFYSRFRKVLFFF